MASAIQQHLDIAAAALEGCQPGYKVKTGSGLSGAAGWYNIDNSPTILLSRIPLLRKLSKIPEWPRDVHRHDVRKGLPFTDQSVGCFVAHVRALQLE